MKIDKKELKKISYDFRSLGGRIIHAWNMVRIDDYREIEAMTALPGDHPKYIGWVPVERILKQCFPC